MSNNNKEEFQSLLPLVNPKSPSPDKTGINVMAVASCFMYSFCSICMVLTNKAISTVVTVEKSELPQFSVILFQCFFAVVFVEISKRLGFVDYPNFDFTVAKSWLPLNVLFIGMLCSGFLSLVYVNVPIVTVFKNVTNLITVFGDWYFFGEKVSVLTVIAVATMTLGAVLAGANDLEFHAVGYFWMILNCFFTASYTLYMRYASVNIKLPRFGMVFYNNLLSTFLLLPVCLFRQEFTAFTNPNLMTVPFILFNIAASTIGFYLNFASLWCVSATTATTYAIVGSMNKIPLTVMGFVFFEAKLTTEGIVFVVMATLGGLLYAYSKLSSK